MRNVLKERFVLIYFAKKSIAKNVRFSYKKLEEN